MENIPEGDKETGEIFGRRIVNIQHFFNQIISFPHLTIFNCTNDNIRIEKEIRVGFKSTLVVRCLSCLETKNIITDDDPEMMNINQAVVFGALGSGVGYTQIRQQFGYCYIPVFSKHLYLKTESELADIIHEVAWEVLEVAGQEEKEVAVSKGHIDPDGIPYTTVIADGAWSKRSYKVNL